MDTEDLIQTVYGIEFYFLQSVNVKKFDSRVKTKEIEQVDWIVTKEVYVDGKPVARYITDAEESYDFEITDEATFRAFAKEVLQYGLEEFFKEEK